MAEELGYLPVGEVDFVKFIRERGLRCECDEMICQVAVRSLQ